MTKFGSSVADRPVVKNETDMLKLPKKQNKKAAVTLPQVAVIKNDHTATELKEMGENWVNHKGPYLTLVETIAIEKTK